MEDPIRLCCGLRHSGAQCPDGKTRCVKCSKRAYVQDMSERKWCPDCETAARGW